MSNHQPEKSSFTTNLGLLLARVPLGAYIAIASFAVIMGGLGPFVSQHLHRLLPFVPETVAQSILYALPFVGVTIGMMIVVGFFTRMAGVIASAILAALLVLTTSIFTAPPEPFNYAVMMLGLSMLLALAGGGGFALDGIMTGKKPAPKKQQA